MFIEVEQGTQQWHDERNSRIGATDAAVIMSGKPFTFSVLPNNVGFEDTNQNTVAFHDHPFRTMSQLWLEKKYGIVQEVSEFAEKLFEHGHEHEVTVVNKISDNLLKVLTPRVVVKDWMIASLDGISSDGKSAVEAKAPMTIKRFGVEKPSKALKFAIEGKIVDYYWVQMQWQFACCDTLEEIIFGVRNPFDESIIEFKVERHDEFIAHMIDTARLVYEDIFNETEEWRIMDKMASEYAMFNEAIKAIELKMQPIKESLLAYAKKREISQTHFSDLYISKQEGRKVVDWKAYFESLDGPKDELIPFTTQSDTSWTVRVR
jgi:hypothetical protein